MWFGSNAHVSMCAVHPLEPQAKIKKVHLKIIALRYKLWTPDGDAKFCFQTLRSQIQLGPKFLKDSYVCYNWPKKVDQSFLHSNCPQEIGTSSLPFSSSTTVSFFAAVCFTPLWGGSKLVLPMLKLWCSSLPAHSDVKLVQPQPVWDAMRPTKPQF